MLLILPKTIKAMVSYTKQAIAWRILSVPLGTNDYHLLIIGLHSYNTQMLQILGMVNTHMGYLCYHDRQ